MAGPFTPRTSYVANRIRRTPWEDRQVILDLLKLEELFSGRRLGGLYMMSLRHGVMPRFPVEALIIEEEIRTGTRLNPIEALGRLAEQTAARFAQAEADRARDRAEQERREHAVYQQWLSVGGLP